MPWEYTEHDLKRCETAIIARHSHGRCLNFGTRSGLGTHALLASRCDYVLSVDNNQDFTDSAAARFIDPRVNFVMVPLDVNGWYDGLVPPTEENRYNTVVLSGPNGLAGRRKCLPMLLSQNFMAPGWQLLVTRTAEQIVQRTIERWLQRFPVKVESIYCMRGITRITARE